MDPVHAIEENGAELLLTLGRAAGAEERGGKVRWTIGNCPIDYHNAVVAADLSPGEADGEILASREKMRELGVPGSWHVGPSMRPADLGERLVVHGFEYAGDDIGMALELAALPERVSVPDRFVVEKVRGEDDLAAWVGTLGSGFGEGPVEAEWVGEMYRRLGYGDEGAVRHFLGQLDGEPVATATLFLGAGVAGVYFVFTVEGAAISGLPSPWRRCGRRGIWATGSGRSGLRRWAIRSTAGWASKSRAGSGSTSGTRPHDASSPGALSCRPSQARDVRRAACGGYRAHGLLAAQASLQLRMFRCGRSWSLGDLWS